MDGIRHDLTKLSIPSDISTPEDNRAPSINRRIQFGTSLRMIGRSRKYAGGQLLAA
jgi:hypothetical protein